jgi:hypothetical protein
MNLFITLLENVNKSRTSANNVSLRNLHAIAIRRSCRHRHHHNQTLLPSQQQQQQQNQQQTTCNLL